MVVNPEGARLRGRRFHDFEVRGGVPVGGRHIRRSARFVRTREGTMARYRSLVLGCFFNAAFALPAQGDFIPPIQLESGELTLHFPDGGLVASAPELFIANSASDLESSVYPLAHCTFCMPGDVVSFNGSWIGTPGFDIFQGTQYTTGGALDRLNEFHVFTPTIVMPP